MKYDDGLRLKMLLVVSLFAAASQYGLASSREDLSVVCREDSARSEEAATRLEDLNTAGLNDILAQCLAAAQKRIEQRSHGLQPREHRLATLVAAHAMLNSAWDAVESASLNATLNATLPDLQEAAGRAAVAEATHSQWNAARHLIKGGLRRLVLFRLFAHSEKELNEFVVNEAYAAAVPVAWEAVRLATKEGLAASELGRRAFRAAEHAALRYLVKNAVELWEFAYDSAASKIVAEPSGAYFFFDAWPANMPPNEFFTPYKNLETSAYL